MKYKEQDLHLENCKNELNKPVQLEIFPEEAQAQIVEVFNAKPEDIRKDKKLKI